MLVLGHWMWWIAAAALLIGEMLLPGFFLLWIAAAAALTGLVSLLFAPGWQADVMIFCGLAAVLVAASWRLVMRQRHSSTDRPHLNRRIDGYVGKTYVLHHAIINGQGKIRIDDTLWDVDGPDLADGQRVTVTAVDGLRLTVVAAS